MANYVVGKKSPKHAPYSGIRTYIKKRGYGKIGDISCWLAIDEVTEVNGCVEVLAGTHKDIIDVKDIRSRKLMREVQHSTDLLIPEKFAGQKSVKMVLKPGQFFFFSQLCLHGYAPNRTENNRVGMAIRFIPAKTSRKLDDPCVLVSGEDHYGHQELILPMSEEE